MPKLFVTPQAPGHLQLFWKDGTVRFCVDYRKLNTVAKFDAYPMHRIEEALNRIGAATCIMTLLDLAKGYWQIPLEEEASREKSALTTQFGLYEFEVMPFGLHNAPATFQRAMDGVLEGCEEFAGGYIDDLVVHSKMWEEHLQHLWEVATRLDTSGWIHTEGEEMPVWMQRSALFGSCDWRREGETRPWQVASSG